MSVMTRILVIDDDPDVRTVMREYLEFAGYEVVEAPNGLIGLHLYRASPADLIITDLHMPHKNGLEVIQDIRRDFPEAKIIAVSSGAWDGQRDVLHMARAIGATRTLEKPFHLRDMLTVVRELLPVSV